MIGDWVETVKEDLSDINLNMNFTDITKMSQDNFKKLVKNKVKTAAFKYLTELQATKSKSKHITYKSLELQSYLKPGNSMTIQDKSFMFQARSRMLQVKGNFKIGLSDIKCRKCKLEDEEQHHIFKCPALEENNVIPNSNIPQYEMLFSDDPKNIMIIGNILRTKFKLLTDNQTNPSAHTTQLNTVTSSAATDSSIVVLQSVELE